MVVLVGVHSLQIFHGVGSVMRLIQYLLVLKTHISYRKKINEFYAKKSSHIGKANQSMKLVNHNIVKQVPGNSLANLLYQTVLIMRNQAGGILTLVMTLLV